MTVRVNGVVRWFGSKGQSFGYITREDGGEIFVHYKSVLPDNQENPKFRTLAPGQYVTFEVAPGYFIEGTQAVKVRVEIGPTEPTVEVIGGLG